VAGKVCADSESGVHNPLRSHFTTSLFSLRACELVSIAGIESGSYLNVFGDGERTRQSQTTQDDAVVRGSCMRVSVGEVSADRGPRENTPTTPWAGYTCYTLPQDGVPSYCRWTSIGRKRSAREDPDDAVG
jgi:hypothetical protein